MARPQWNNMVKLAMQKKKSGQALYSVPDTPTAERSIDAIVRAQGRLSI